jgi:hypothetical protein
MISESPTNIFAVHAASYLLTGHCIEPIELLAPTDNATLLLLNSVVILVSILNSVVILVSIRLVNLMPTCIHFIVQRSPNADHSS